MYKGTYTFPDKSVVDVYYKPSLSTDDSVYVEWLSEGGVKQTMWLPSKGLCYKN